MNTIIIAGPSYGQPQPVRLNVGGRQREYPVNTEVNVDDAELAALRNTDHEITLIEGGTAADEAEEQAPAPAGSGDGGDAGGGGESGDPATDDSDGEAEAIPHDFLDRSVTAIIADLPSLSPGQLQTARQAEELGKTRKSLIAAIDEAIAASAV